MSCLCHSFLFPLIVNNIPPDETTRLILDYTVCLSPENRTPNVQSYLSPSTHIHDYIVDPIDTTKNSAKLNAINAKVIPKETISIILRTCISCHVTFCKSNDSSIASNACLLFSCIHVHVPISLIDILVLHEITPFFFFCIINVHSIFFHASVLYLMLSTSVFAPRQLNSVVHLNQPV